MPEADDLLRRGTREREHATRRGTTWHGHVVVCGLDDVGAARRRAAAPVRRAGRRRRRRARTAPADTSRRARRRTPRRRRPAPLDAGESARWTTAAALICAEPVRPGEPRDRAAGPAAAARACASSSSSATRRWAGRSAGSPARTACWTPPRIAAPTLAESCLDLRSRPDRPSPATRSSCASSIARRTGTLRSLFGDLAPIAVVPGRRRRPRCTSAPAATSRSRAGDRVVRHRPAGRPRRPRRSRRPPRPGTGDAPVAPGRHAAPLRPRLRRRERAGDAAGRCAALLGVAVLSVRAAAHRLPRPPAAGT